MSYRNTPSKLDVQVVFIIYICAKEKETDELEVLFTKRKW